MQFILLVLAPFMATFSSKPAEDSFVRMMKSEVACLWYAKAVGQQTSFKEAYEWAMAQPASPLKAQWQVLCLEDMGALGAALYGGHAYKKR